MNHPTVKIRYLNFYCKKKKKQKIKIKRKNVEIEAKSDSCDI